MAYTKQNNTQTNNVQVKKQYPKLDVREFIGELKCKALEDSGKKKDNSSWEKWRLTFKQDNDKYPEKVFKNQFTPFNFPKSLKIEELENKKFYRILFVTENKKNTKTGNDYKFNRILGIYMHNNPQNNNQGGMVQNSNIPPRIQNIPPHIQPPHPKGTNYEEMVAYDKYEGQNYEKYQQPYQKPLTEAEKNLFNTCKEPFSTIEEWLKIAENSGIFENEARARYVYNEMTK